MNDCGCFFLNCGELFAGKNFTGFFEIDLTVTHAEKLKGPKKLRKTNSMGLR